MRPFHSGIRAERGFTLIELLIVILIIGVLAAIAIPSFLDQKGKADDATAKELARAASEAAETYETEHSGNYVGVNAGHLRELDHSLQITEGNNNAYLESAEEFESGKGYVVTSVAPTSNDTFSITRTASGEFKRTCRAQRAPVAAARASGEGPLGRTRPVAA